MISNILNRRETLQVSERSLSLSTTQLTMDALIQNFSEQSGDLRSIAGMTFANMVGQSIRLGILSLPVMQKFSPLLSSTLARGVSLFGEATTLASFQNTPIRHQIVMLGSLHLFGSIQAPSPLLSHAITSLGMVVGQNLSAAAGLTQASEESFANQWLRAEVENIQWQGSSALFHFASGGRSLQIQQQLRLSIESRTYSSRATTEIFSDSREMLHSFSTPDPFRLLRTSVGEARNLRRGLFESHLEAAERESMLDHYLHCLHRLNPEDLESLNEVFRGLEAAKRGMSEEHAFAYKMYPRVMEILAAQTEGQTNPALATNLIYEFAYIYESIHTQTTEDSKRVAAVDAYPHLLRARLNLSRQEADFLKIYREGEGILKELNARVSEIHTPAFYKAAFRSMPQIFRELAPYFCDTDPYNELLENQIHDFPVFMSRLRFSKVVVYAIDAFTNLAQIPEPSPKIDLLKEEVALELIRNFSNHGLAEVRETSLYNVLSIMESLPTNAEALVGLILHTYHSYHGLIVDPLDADSRAESEGIDAFIRLFSRPRPVSNEEFASLEQRMNHLLNRWDQIPRENRSEDENALKAKALLRILALLRRTMTHTPEERSPVVN